jgi:plastocyanin
MRVALVFVALAMFVPARASAATIPVEIPGLLYEPKTVVALVGDTVTWSNQSSQPHTVTALDDSFDSGAFAPGESFEQVFTAQGTFGYYCTIHRFMAGEVDVFAIALTAPSEAIRPRGQATLTGKVRAGTASVTIEEGRPDGSFFAVGTTAPTDDGSFTFEVSPTLPTVYRAVAGELRSPVVSVSVSARVTLLALRGTGPAVQLFASTTPAQPRARVVLERYVRERFTWVAVSHSRLDRQGKARLRYEPKRPVWLRMRLLDGVGGYGPAVSPPVVVRPHR